jgi:hypothetical protein
MDEPMTRESMADWANAQKAEVERSMNAMKEAAAAQLVKATSDAAAAARQHADASGTISWLALPAAFGAIYSTQEQLALPLSYARFFLFAPMVREYLGKMTLPLAWMLEWTGMGRKAGPAEEAQEVEEIAPPVAIVPGYRSTYIEEAAKIATSIEQSSKIAIYDNDGLQNTALQACKNTKDTNNNVKKMSCDCRMTCNHHARSYSMFGYSTCSQSDDALLRRADVLDKCGYSTTDSLAVTSFFRVLSQGAHDVLVGPAQLFFVLVTLSYVASTISACFLQGPAARTFAAQRAAVLACLWLVVYQGM